MLELGVLGEVLMEVRVEHNVIRVASSKGLASTLAVSMVIGTAVALLWTASEIEEYGHTIAMIF